MAYYQSNFEINPLYRKFWSNWSFWNLNISKTFKCQFLRDGGGWGGGKGVTGKYSPSVDRCWLLTGRQVNTGKCATAGPSPVYIENVVTNHSPDLSINWPITLNMAASENEQKIQYYWINFRK